MVELGRGLLIAGRYRLQAHLGEGGMGTVWSAQHELTRREVALKFLRRELLNREDLRNRFLREARAASALRHPNVIEVLDVFELEDQSPAMVMELLHGETLGQRLARDERLSLEETADILLPVIGAVKCAHTAGIVHRDLKPENIFLVRWSQDEASVKVLDFGIAKLSAQHYVDQSQTPAAKTDAGSVLGTPRYMAPEQLTDNSNVDHRADIWSLGTILYECLSGMRPIEGQHVAEVVGRLLSGVIVPLSQLAPDLPADVAALVQRMLAREPARRLSDLDAAVEVLERYHLRSRSSRNIGPDRSLYEPKLAPQTPQPPRSASHADSTGGSSAGNSAPTAIATGTPSRDTHPAGGIGLMSGRLTRLAFLGSLCLLLLLIAAVMFKSHAERPSTPDQVDVRALPSPAVAHPQPALPPTTGHFPSVRETAQEAGASKPLPTAERVRAAERGLTPKRIAPRAAGRAADPPAEVEPAGPEAPSRMPEESLFSGRK